MSVSVEDEKKEKKTKKIKEVTHEWDHLNGQKPIWMRKPDEVTQEEYAELNSGTDGDFMDEDQYEMELEMEERAKLAARHQSSSSADAPPAPLEPGIMSTRTQIEKEFKHRTLSHSTQARHRCELARASTITGTPPEPPKRLR
mgnify:CR=1 FL=1